MCTHLFQSQHSPQLPHAGYIGMAEAQQWEQCVCLGAKPQKTISGVLEMGNTELGARAGTQDLEMAITKTQNCAVIPVRNYVFPSCPFASAKYCSLLLLLCRCSWDGADDGEHILKVILVLQLVEIHIQPPVVHLETCEDPVSFWCWKLNYRIVICKAKSCLGYLLQCFPYQWRISFFLSQNIFCEGLSLLLLIQCGENTENKLFPFSYKVSLKGQISHCYQSSFLQPKYTPLFYYYSQIWVSKTFHILSPHLWYISNLLVLEAEL